MLPALSKEGWRMESLWFKKRRQLLQKILPRKKLKIFCLELYNVAVKVATEDPVNEIWLGF